MAPRKSQRRPSKTEHYVAGPASASAPASTSNPSSGESPDDTRINGEIPEVGSKLKVNGLDFLVTVQRVEETVNVDGNGEPVCMIYIKAPTRSMQSMLPSGYLNSQVANYVIQEQPEESMEESDKAEWEDFDSHELNEKVRRYITGIGWCNGEIVSAKRKKTNPTEIRYTALYTNELNSQWDEELNGEEYAEAAKYASMTSPPTAPPSVLAAMNNDKDTEEKSDMVVSRTPAAASSASNDNATSTIVVYDGAGGSSTIPELVAQANNTGLGFTNPYIGRASIDVMNKERNLSHRMRDVSYMNQGQWVFVWKSNDKDDSRVTPKLIFPDRALDLKKLPSIGVGLAEVSFMSKSKHDKFNAQRTLSRGSVYRALNHLGEGENSAFYYLHCILKEDSSLRRLFNFDLVVVSVFSIEYEKKFDSRILVFNKASVRDKTPVLEPELKNAFAISDGELRSICQTAESNFVVWYNNESPVLNTDNTRMVSRRTDAIGAGMFPSDVVVDLVDDTETETEKKCTRNPKGAKSKRERKKKDTRYEATGLGGGIEISSDKTSNLNNPPSKRKANSRLESPAKIDSRNCASSPSCPASGNMHGKMISPNSHSAAIATARDAVTIEWQAKTIIEAQKYKSECLNLSQSAQEQQRKFFQDTMHALRESTTLGLQQIHLQNVANAYQRFENPTLHHANMFKGLMGMSRIYNQTIPDETSESAELPPSFPISSITNPLSAAPNHIRQIL